ncbi:hypothetical protein HN858_04950 [Candidatus Falkowbacteria bacterium]|jgi:hypothetical protein|nr:hypothetical protein [Candidatus Falkowbacteria bacterium]MBT5503129.1 hypothetical protein [Candidatus Falkowbacteria bacterium]MBT6574517.1 hypothetical protein [Candidatus Falkowbacteria bacterium]MBT7348987.1 hypothetical protein [Candidatus Falkowbacteria bacterium]MBT7500578.1 hypothetical protein [Candidatus Falkowbacteria bacterium]
MKMKFRFISTEYDVDRISVPFYEPDEPLGPILTKAIRDVFDGTNCPYFTHITADDGATGYIAVCSQELTDTQINLVHDVWWEVWANEEIGDKDVFEFEVA